MKLILGIVAYLLIGLLLGWGILLTVRGQPWLLLAGFAAYVIAVGRLGCLPKKPTR